MDVTAEVSARIRDIFAEAEVARVVSALRDGAGDGNGDGGGAVSDGGSDSAGVVLNGDKEGAEINSGGGDDNGGGDVLRLVGGTVRDIILGRELGDERDFATPLLPDEVEERLKSADIQTLTMGKDHGTITAVLQTTNGHRHLEITTLREDIETDGRHARVRYTRDWRMDSCRRDFTINALYADAAGRVYDFHGGLEDLAARRVCFVGDAAARIREDYLRVLRFYRFSALMGDFGGDSSARSEACAAAVEGLAGLSGERVWSELRKMLSGERGWVGALGAMESDGVLAGIFPPDHLIDDIAAAAERLYGLEKEVVPTFVEADSGLFRFASLFELIEDHKGLNLLVKGVSGRLHLSRRERDYLGDILSPFKVKASDDLLFRRRVYEQGVERVLHWLILLRTRGVLDDELFGGCVEFLRGWRAVKFPVNGDDLAEALGLGEGPELGRILRELEDWWLLRDCEPDRSACLRHAPTLLH
ncbi:MAG: CCA tRNA nucleotidyltransferase [Alphaproteobacteria bacterium]|nr:CCA tRNA nucleotidyltransferase [Alphaproteobacteria bacterium]